MTAPPGVPTSLVTRYGSDAVDAVARVLEAVRRRGDLAQVTVLVPSNYAGLSLRRELGRRHGLVNVAFMVPARAAELLAAPRLPPGSLPLTRPVRRQAIRAALNASTGPFAQSAAHTSTVDALDAAFRELRTLDASTLEQLAARSARGRALVEAFRAFRELVVPFHDEVDRFAAAAAAVNATTGPSPALGHVVAFLPRGLDPESQVLLDALALRGRLTVIEPAAGDPASADVAGRISIASAADADEEVRVALRLVSAALDAGQPLHRIGVLLPSSSAAARCFELFAASGIPCNGAAPGTLAASLAGRALLALLSIEARAFERNDVLSALALSLPGIEGYTPRWNAIARDARITRGSGRWSSLLEAHAASLRADAAAQPEERDALRAMLERDAGLTDALRTAFARLQELLPPSESDSWAGLSAWATATLDRMDAALRRDGDDLRVDEVRQALVELATLDDFGVRATPGAFLDALQAALSAQPLRFGRFEQGVFVGTLDAAYGMTFDIAIVPGLAEGEFPLPLSEDPLIPPADRAGLPALQQAVGRRRQRQRQAFLSALAASQVVLAFPAADLAAQRAAVPSPWLLEIATLLHGAPVHGATLARWVESPPRPAWLRVTPSFASAATDRDTPASPAEWTLSALASPNLDLSHPLVAAQPSLRRALGMLRARASSTFTPHDGHLGPLPGLAVADGPVVSPTRLEDWARCGYRYFLQTVLHVTENEEPEEPDAIDARDRGSLVHAILDEFFSTHATARAPAEAWTAGDADRMHELVSRHVAEAARSGRLGRFVPWRVEEARIRDGLRAFLNTDSAWRAREQLTFLAAEFGFGRHQHAARPGDAMAAPLRIETKGGTVTLRGEIDRVDRGPAGSLTVYDYKTGRPPRAFDADPFDAGARLQLPVYALAAREAFDGSRVRAAYWHLLRDRGPGEFAIDISAARESEFRALLGSIAAGIGAGIFPARSGRPGTPDLCRFCPFDLVCPVDRARAFARKSSDPAMRPFVELGRHGEPSDDDGDGDD